jgi:hypothetical protein
MESKENGDMNGAAQENISADHAAAPASEMSERKEASTIAASVETHNLHIEGGEQARQEKLAEIKSAITAEGTAKTTETPTATPVTATPAPKEQGKLANAVGGGVSGLFRWASKGFKALGKLFLMSLQLESAR